MGKPQLEDGYTMVANQLLEAITRTPLGQHEYRVFFCVLRLTYGYQKKEADIPISLITRITLLPKQLVWRALHHLTQRNMLTKIGTRHYAVQKDYSTWVEKSSPEITFEKSSLEITKVIPTDDEKSSLEPTFRHGIKKKENYKENTLRSSPDREEFLQTQEFLRHKTGRKSEIDYLRRSRSFKEWLAYLNKATNKVGVLIEAFKTFHKHAPDQDWQNLGGRMANLFKVANKDAGYLLRVLWETSAADIAGSHLNFIQGRLRAPRRSDALLSRLPSAEELESSWKGDQTSV